MTLLYFDGFDLHNRVLNGLDVGAGSMQDAGYYWRAGTITRYDFPAGYQEGNSLRVTTSGTNNGGGIGLNGRTGRVGFWATWNPTRVLSLVVASRPGWSAEVSVDTSGVVTFFVNGVSIGSASVNPSEWAYYETYFNAQGGQYSFSQNGITLIQGTATPLTSGGNLAISLGNASLDSSPNYRVDHLWITDGPFPSGSDILGVQVVGALDKYESLNDGFVGSLVIAGNRYVSNFMSPVVQSQANYADGLNLVNVLNFMFTTDPSTGSPWTRDSFNTIEKWGLCYVPRSSRGTMRVAGLLLATLEYNNGRPLVKNRKVDGAGEFSGPWSRSNSTKSFSWHLQDVPREDIPLVEHAKSLFIGGEGCALFRGPAETVEPTIPEFQEVGVTFAEEFREDYTDWVRVDGVGANFDSFFISGYGVYGDGNRKFQSNYVTVNYENVPTGGAYIQGLWDYTIDPDTGRWSMKQNVYKDTDGHKHGTRKLKIRGHGKTLQLLVSSRDGRPFKINGWTIMVTSNTSV